ncbi:MAG: hypothetical protein AAFV07_12715 [Bacteroidota bacterium]
MRLIYLSEANLRDRLFVRDLVFNYKTQDKALLIHATFGGTVSDTRFVTKRLSALYSEAMVYNNAFPAGQRNIFQSNTEGQLVVDTDRIDSLLQTIQMLIISPIMPDEVGEDKLVDPLQLLQASRYALEADEVLVFPDNPMSPLASQKPLINEAADLQKWQAIYEEEGAALSRAMELRPARMVSPQNYGQ